MRNRGRVAGAFSAAAIVVATTLSSLPAHAHEPPVIDVGDPFDAAAMHARIFTDDDGLPQNSIESLRFAPDGLLWATTREGGASFDGSGWRPVPMPANSGSNWPRVTLSSADGAAWFGIEGGGLYRYLRGSWAGISDPRLDRHTVVALAESSSRPQGRRTIWAGSQAGLVRIDPSTLEVLEGLDVGGASVTALHAVGNGVLVGTATGAVLRCGASRCDADPAASSLTAGARVTGFAVDGDGSGSGTTWIATDAGVIRDGPGSRALELAGKRVNAVILARSPRGTSAPWVALDGEGILVRLDGRWIAPPLSPSLPNGFVFTLAAFPVAGPTRHIFAGTLTGVVRIDVGAWRSVDSSAGLPDSSVFSTLDAGGASHRELFLGTSAGLARFERGAWRRVDADLVGRAPVFALLESRDGATLYAGTNAGLVSRRGGSWIPDRADAGLPRASVVSLLETGSGDSLRLWAGTYGSGLWHRGSEATWTRQDRLPDERIEALASSELDGVTQLWVATNRGLARIAAGDVEVIDRERGLPSDIVRSLLLATGPDGAEYLWVGTAGGLAWRPAAAGDARWQTLSSTADASLPGDNIYQIRAESPTRFWLFTGRGVVRLTFPAGAHPLAASASLKTFTTADGLPANECNFGASMIDTAGRIWVGTTRGAAIFDPSASIDDRTPKTLLITDARSTRRPADLGSNPRLSHDQNDLTFSFRLIDPGRGDRAMYRSQLVGQDDEPGVWTRAAERTFTGLPPGQYRFRVWGRDPAGNVSGPVDLDFLILTPAWRAWWAVLGYIAVAIAGLAAFHRLRLRRLSTRAEKLERIVRSRTRDLERMNRELEAANTALADMSVTDPLTGAKNRRYLGQQMEREASRVGRSMRSGDDLMFFIVDIDLFKHVNDAYGHTVGDAVLRQFCGALASAVRDTDTIVRWGGEEFLVVARRSSRAEATRIADRIIETVRAEVFDAFDGRLIQLTCSLGWAVFPFVPDDPGVFAWDEVVDIADHCLLAAKASGRNCWVGLTAGRTLEPDRFFQRLRTSVRTMTDALELEVSTSLSDPSSVRWQ